MAKTSEISTGMYINPAWGSCPEFQIQIVGDRVKLGSNPATIVLGKARSLLELLISNKFGGEEDNLGRPRREFLPAGVKEDEFDTWKQKHNVYRVTTKNIYGILIARIDPRKIYEDLMVWDPNLKAHRLRALVRMVNDISTSRKKDQYPVRELEEPEGDESEDEPDLDFVYGKIT